MRSSSSSTKPSLDKQLSGRTDWVWEYNMLCNVKNDLMRNPLRLGVEYACTYRDERAKSWFVTLYLNL